jgi:peptide/nickel transport system permease protein
LVWRVVGFVLRRVLVSGLLLLGVTLVTFGLFFWVPSSRDQGTYLVGRPNYFQQVDRQARAAYDRRLAEANHELGVDRSVIVQYERYVQRLAHGSLGTSWDPYRPVPVTDLLGPALRVTGSLLVGGVAILLLVAVPLGVLAALRAGGFLDRITLAVTLVGLSLPPFLVSVVLCQWLEPRLGMMTTSPFGGVEGPVPQTGYCHLLPQHVVHPGPGAACGGVTAWIGHLWLPWVAFAAGIVALYVRMVRAGVLDTLDEPYVQTARAKGASEARVLRSHVLRPTLAPLLTMLSMDVGMALGTVLFVETAFNLPGIGLLTNQAILHEGTEFDLPVIAGIVLVGAAAIITLNLLADVLVGVLDPRTRARGVA